LFRPLPASQPGQFWADSGVHWIKADENGKPTAVMGCRETAFGESCPVCAEVESAIKSASDDESLKIMKKWKSKSSVYFNAICRDGVDASLDPQVLELTTTTAGGVFSIMEEWDDITDPVSGMDIIIERKGKGLDTEYTVMPSPKSDKVDPKVLEKGIDLLAYIEREHFRVGEEEKAIRSIANISGITPVARIAAVRNSALLTGAAVAGAEIIEPKAAGRVATPVEDEEVLAAADAAIEGDLLEKVEVIPPTKPVVAPKAAVKPAAVAAVAPVAAVAATEAFGAPLDDSDIDSMLSDLDDI
jgi:hypothetical protein